MTDNTQKIINALYAEQELRERLALNQRQTLFAELFRDTFGMDFCERKDIANVIQVGTNGLPYGYWNGLLIKAAPGTGRPYDFVLDRLTKDSSRFRDIKTPRGLALALQEMSIQTAQPSTLEEEIFNIQQQIDMLEQRLESDPTPNLRIAEFVQSFREVFGISVSADDVKIDEDNIPYIIWHTLPIARITFYSAAGTSQRFVYRNGIQNISIESCKELAGLLQAVLKTVINGMAINQSHD